MANRLFSIFTLMILCSFISCSKTNESNGTEPEEKISYVDFPEITGEDAFPSSWLSSDKRIHFSINKDQKQKRLGEYQIWCGNGGSIASGSCRYGFISRNDDTVKCLVLDPPPEKNIDFTKSTGTDQEKKALLDYMFPDGKSCVIEQDKDYMDFNNKGGFVYRDSAFLIKPFTQTILPNSDTMIQGLPAVYLGRKDYTAKDRAYVYSQPDITSKKISSFDISWSSYSGENKVNKLYANDYEMIDWYHGIQISVYGRTREKFNVDGIEDYWYYVSDYRGGSWVFGGAIEEWDISKKDEYATFIIDNGIKDGLIAVQVVDYSKYPSDVDYIGIGEEGESGLYYTDKEIYFAFPYDGFFVKYDRSALATDRDGFTKFTYGPKEDDKYIFIFGSQITQYFTNFQHDGKLEYDDDEEYHEGQYHDYYFKSISASSSFSETLGGRKINYAPVNLERCFEVGCKCHPYWWNYRHIPWVEGAQGNGIGESITVEFTEEMQGMSILNGYTALNKLKLYKENSRLKEILVEDLVNGGSQTVTFDDKVYFNYINFPKKTTKVKITIKSVYEGSKYTDTCVSAIIPSPSTPYKLDSDGMKELKKLVNDDFKNLIRTCVEISPEELLAKFR